MTFPITPELQSKLADWRIRAVTNDPPLSVEEMCEAVVLLRGGRLAAAAASAPSTRKRAITAIPNQADMLDELEGL